MGSLNDPAFPHFFLLRKRSHGFQIPDDTTTDLRQAVAGILEVTRWDKGFADCECPACHRADARLFYDGKFPVVFCFSSGCATQNASVNEELRQRTKQIFGENGIPFKLTKEEKEQVESRRRLKAVEARAKNLMLPQLLKQPSVPLESWAASSPYPMRQVPVPEHWRLLLMALHKQEPAVSPYYVPGKGLYSGFTPPPIWIGELWETGKPEFARNFKSVVDWLKKRRPYGPQISVCTFQPSRYKGNDVLYLRNYASRSKEWVKQRLYLVLESDTLSREQFGHVIRWAMKFLTLRCIVDTGGKSIHAWFEAPDFPVPLTPDFGRLGDQDFEDWSRRHDEHRQRYAKLIVKDAWRKAAFYRRRDEFYAILTGLGCDPGMFRLASTARLPGVERTDDEGNPTGRWQQLIHLNPKYPIEL